MSSVVTEILAANEQYANAFGEKANLPIPPARKMAVLTCMDSRLDPTRFLGLREGDAHIIRNAGGRASDDAIRSLVISYKLLGTRDWFVIHHTECGMQYFTNDVIRGLLRNSLETASLTAEGFVDVGQGPGSDAGDYIEWLTIRDQIESVQSDIRRIQNHPLVPPSITVHGYLYDVKTGKLHDVPSAA